MKEENKSLLKTIAELSTLGLTMVFATFIGLATGLYIDSKLNTSPWLTILFLIIGIAAGFNKAIQVAIREAKKKGNNGTKNNSP